MKIKFNFIISCICTSLFFITSAVAGVSASDQQFHQKNNLKQQANRMSYLAEL